MTQEFFEIISKQVEFMNDTMLRVEIAVKEDVKNIKANMKEDFKDMKSDIKDVKKNIGQLPCHKHDLEIQEVQINIKNSKKWLSFAVFKSIAPTLKSLTAIVTAISATCAAAYAYFK